MSYLAKQIKFKLRNTQIHRRKIKNYKFYYRTDLKNVYITDISWYRDKLYLVTNVSTVMWFNITSLEKGMMSNMENVGSLAVDWVGKKIYWSNPKQQLVSCIIYTPK